MGISELLVWLFLLTAIGFAFILGLLWLHKTIARKDHAEIKATAKNESK